jgi:hypothetical protein
MTLEEKMPDYPVHVELYLVGQEMRGHVFHVHVEEPVEGTLALHAGRDVRMPWLRAACSCGWVAVDDERCTIEENALWHWETKHVDSQT